MKILKIIKGTAADGVGLRNSVYVAGCIHHCPGCHNPQSWDFNNGHDMTVEEVFNEVYDDYCDVTLTGGDPALQHRECLDLCKRLKAHGKNIWMYTGYLYEDLKARCPELLKFIDVLVDGRYDQKLRDVTTRFCGSTNQRIIHLKNGEITSIE